MESNNTQSNQTNDLDYWFSYYGATFSIDIMYIYFLTPFSAFTYSQEPTFIRLDLLQLSKTAHPKQHHLIHPFNHRFRLQHIPHIRVYELIRSPSLRGLLSYAGGFRFLFLQHPFGDLHRAGKGAQVFPGQIPIQKDKQLQHCLLAHVFIQRSHKHSIWIRLLSVFS